MKRLLTPQSALAATLIALLILGLSTPSMAQEAKRKTKRHTTLRQRLQLGDSLRLELRKAADEGRMLQWGDSLLRARQKEGKISEAEYNKTMRRLKHADRMFHRGDSVLASKYEAVNYDTLYITRPRDRWTIRFQGSAGGSILRTTSNPDGLRHDTRLSTDYQATAAAGFTYRGIGFSLSVNPAKLVGRNKDNEIDVNSYSNRYGFDLIWLSSKTWHGHTRSEGVKTHIDRGTASQHALNFNGYYAFNYRRFSMPAAFSQTYLQRRSAGSLLLGVSAVGMKNKSIGDEATGGQPATVRLWLAGLGIGYGYNIVLGTRWLIHLSEIPTISVYTHGSIRTPDEKLTMHYHMPSAILTGRGALVYAWKNKFIGGTIVATYSVAGDKTQLQVRRNKFMTRAFFGFRF